jgi:cell division protein FtsB
VKKSAGVPSFGSDIDCPKLPARHRRGRWISRLLLFVTYVLTVNALVGERGLAESLKAQRRLEDATAELALLRFENSALREVARELQQDLQTLENVAREELGLIREGEILVVLKSAPSR